MDDLIGWLRARLDEDERRALDARSTQYDWENGWGLHPPSSGGNKWTITPHVGLIHEQVQAEHVAAWNPARVLAEIATKRAILDVHVHEITTEYAGETLIASDFGCTVCGLDKYEIPYGGWCATVRALASPHSGLPGWRDEWAADSP